MSSNIIAWFTLGALFGFTYSWLSRYNRMKDFNRLRGFSHENIAPNSSKQRPRSFTTDWRHSFSHENTNRPGGPPPLKLRRSAPDPSEQFIRMDPGLIQRGNGGGGPTTPKPQIVPKGQRASNGSVTSPNVNPWNEAQALRSSDYESSTKS